MELDIRRINALLKQDYVSNDQLREICTVLLKDRECIREHVFNVGCDEVSCGAKNEVLLADVFENVSDLECTPDWNVTPETKWRHKNGNLYTVLHVANMKSDHRDMTVVYQGVTGAVWTKPLCEWRDSMSDVRHLPKK